MVSVVSERYDLVCVGSGFATGFFLLEYLRHAAPDARVLVLERGPDLTHRERVDQRRDVNLRSFQGAYRNLTPHKPWYFTLGRGGSSNCWVGNTPRMLPSDFKLKSSYGVGEDWPVDYDELEPFIEEVEARFGVAGGETPYPRRSPHPYEPHHLSVPDRALARAYPGAFVPMPVAKPRKAPSATRPGCCSSMSCMLCPVDAKFTILNGMADVFGDPRVSLRLGARVERVDHAAGVATGVTYSANGGEQSVAAELVVLGANALFNPFLLLRSGLEGPWVGEGLCEQVGISATVDLAGMKSFQGTTMHTGLGYMLYDGLHRRERAAALIESNNVPGLRPEHGRYRERYGLNFIFEDLPQRGNRVTIDAEDPSRPAAEFHHHSAYAEAGLAALRDSLDSLLSPLPVERIELDEETHDSEFHIQCSTRMGRSAGDSVVDPQLVHHRLRNLVVAGSSVFPTAPPANPTLTLSALAMRSARHLMGGAA